jgi:hypothetical protein
MAKRPSFAGSSTCRDRFEKLLSDTAKLIEHCNTEPEEDVMTAAEALLEN